MKLTTFVTASILTLVAGQVHAITFSSNGNATFGGAMGQGGLTLTDNGTTISGTITRGPGNFNDALVIYIDSVAGGFTDTSLFTDTSDDLRKAISGYDGSNRSTLTFASGFLPDYALALGGNAPYNYGGVWQLNGAAPFHQYIDTLNLSPTGTGTASTYTFSFPVSDIGLTANSGATFKLFATYLSNTGYRSGEAIVGDLTGTVGVNPFTQTSFDNYTIVPEPSTIALVGFGLLGACFIRRRK